MFILDSTVKSLQIALGGAPTTNQLPFTTSFVDVTTTSQAVTPGAQDGVTTGTTAVTIMASPISGNERRLVAFSLINSDTAAATVIFELNDNSTVRNTFKMTLSVGDNLIISQQDIRVFDSNGNFKTIQSSLALPLIVANGGTGDSTLTAHAVLLGEGTGNVAFATIGTSGRLLIDQGSGTDPSFNAMSGDATITNAGVITLGALSHALNMNSHLINNVTDPSSAQDAATKNYVDTTIATFDSKPSVAYASTSALPANTYSNGSSGVGAMLTGNSDGPLVIDGVTIVTGQVGERVLVAGEAAPANNGWYTITQIGVVAVSPYILTRATESNTGAQIGSGYLTSVIAPNTVTPGTANNGKVFISIAAADPFVVGTTSLTFSQVGGVYSADGTTLNLSGTTFSIKSTYVGQTSITTLGTIGTGVWNGTRLTSSYVPTDVVYNDVTATLAAGYNVTSYSGGTQSSGTYTPAVGNAQNNQQYITNGGAFTLGVPASDGTWVILITNNGSAGTITTSSYTKVTGDSFDTTNTHAFMCFISVVNSISLLNVVKMQ